MKASCCPLPVKGSSYLNNGNRRKRLQVYWVDTIIIPKIIKLAEVTIWQKNVIIDSVEVGKLLLENDSGCPVEKQLSTERLRGEMVFRRINRDFLG
jgi:hypothetical protein